MTYLNAKKYINSAPDSKLESDSNILTLLEAAGNPHKHIEYLRLAGSNGKTVCAEMLMSVMGAANYRVGCLRMPLREEPRENICIGKDCLTMDEFSRLTALVRSLSAELAITPTKAEILLAVALLAFKNNNCALYIIECDHFGEDPSRFLPSPFAAVICGTIPSNSTREISRIRSYIRRGVREIISSPQNSEAYRVIYETCISVNCRLTLPSKNKISIGKMSLGGTEFSYKDKQYKLGLCGKFQVSNAALVLETVEMLTRKNFNISQEAISAGLAKIKIPAKFEIISLSPIIIVDSTHTRVAVDTVCDSLADFKERTGSKIRLCLPGGELVSDYVNALEKRGYQIEKTIVFDDGDDQGYPENNVAVKTTKAMVKAALDSLTNDTVLLISGDYPFVNPVRYQLLSTMGF